MKIRWVCVCVVSIWLAACGKKSYQESSSATQPVTVRDILIPATNIVEILKLSPLPSVPPKPTNQYADNQDAAALGQALFFDTGLSANGEVSCATCHQAENDWTDGKSLSEGLEQVGKNAPTLWNVGYQRWYFWDGRRDSLWSQALGPIEHPSEMGGSRLRTYRLIADQPTYRDLYERVFGKWPDLISSTKAMDARPVPDDTDHDMHMVWQALSVTDRSTLNRVFSHVGKSMEAYQRQLISTDSDFDQFASGLRLGEKEMMEQLSDRAIRGLILFTGRGQCTLCHTGPNFTDNEFHNIGLDLGDLSLDQGRFLGVDQVKSDPFNGLGDYSDDTSMEANKFLHYVGTKDNNLGEFKTPTLRNVSKTGPYMHDGRFATLHEVVEFYSTLPDTPAIGHREESLQPLNLTSAEMGDLVAFLESLTGKPLDQSLMKKP